MFTVLIDTCAYETHGLSFKGGVFTLLEKLSREDKVKIVSSSIISREVEGHLKESIAQAINRIDKAYKGIDHITKNNLGVISTALHDAVLLKESIFQERLEAFNKFLLDVNSENIRLKLVDIEALVDDYFNKNAPFGEGKKKNEFPDAIILHAFVSEMESNLNQACLVSNDPDWKKYSLLFPQINFFENISQLLDFIHTDYDTLFIQQLKNGIEYIRFEIQNKVSDDLKDRFEFEFSDDWFEPYPEIDPDSIIVEILSYNIIDFASWSVECDVELQITYELDVSATDSDSWMKDPETKEILYGGSNRYTIKINRICNAIVNSSFEPHSVLSTIEVEDISLPDELFYINSEDEDCQIELVSRWDDDH